ncbi:hypothetical protein Cob_v009557 [Colletotrichum orbiculare MAFF 240422]|uniref:Uncharacterized protein n=1 Tax=Colletotrichum orbiculare (strain 104-T / ATCC 96160 / CBS 514.97 / LARS 414 / MAFF 240422) TaxID=1213857 RepID=A0A484FIK9_COLOR|nr:hypothetical protein Cob_v009557 [Colletotrichum orbiculare MAFF 240422]
MTFITAWSETLQMGPVPPTSSDLCSVSYFSPGLLHRQAAAAPMTCRSRWSLVDDVHPVRLPIGGGRFCSHLVHIHGQATSQNPIVPSWEVDAAPKGTAVNEEEIVYQHPGSPIHSRVQPATICVLPVSALAAVVTDLAAP